MAYNYGEERTIQRIGEMVKKSSDRKLLEFLCMITVANKINTLGVNETYKICSNMIK